MVAVADTSTTAVVTAAPRVRRIGVADLHWALREGWRDFGELRGDILLVGFVYPLVVLVAAGVALGGDLFPLMAPIVGGLALLGPLLAVGFYELARRREDGRDAGWGHFLDPFRGPSRREIVALGAMVAVLFTAWLGVAWIVYENTLGRLELSGPGPFLAALFTTAEGWRMMLVGNLIGLGFAIVVLAATVASFPMLVDGRTHASEAVATSLEATRRNPATVGLWGFYIAALLTVACIPLFIGLAVALPVLGYASWHLYTRLVDRDGS